MCPGIEDRDPIGGLLGREQLRPLDPVGPARSHDAASARRIRSCVVATSMPPTPYHAGPSSVSSPEYRSTEYCARRHIVREPFVWNTSPGACEVEPPVSKSGP